MRRSVIQLGVAVFASAMALNGNAHGAGTSGPVAPVPHPTILAPLGCAGKVVAYGTAVDGVNSLSTTLAKGKVISWSYRYTGGGGQSWPTPAEGRVKTGSTTLTASLAPGQTVRLDLINKSYKVSDCKASVAL